MKSLRYTLLFASLLAVVGAEPKVLRLVGLIDVSGDKRALLAMPDGPPGLRLYQELREGSSIGHLELKKIDSAQEEVEVQSEAKPMHIGFAGEREAASLPGRIIRLEKCPLQQVIELYASLTGRSALQHPALKPQTFTLREKATTRTEAALALKNALEQSGIKIQLEGNKFALVLPGTTGPISMVSFDMAAPDSSDNAAHIIPAGSLQMENMPVDQALELYALLAGRTVAVDHRSRAGSITFKAQTDLTRAEALRAFDTLFGWHGLRLVLVDDAIKAVPVQIKDSR